MNFKEQLDATKRTVEVGTESDSEVRTLTLTWLFDTSEDSLWSACTTADELGRWFLPISGDLHEGGRYEIRDIASGLIRQCRPKRLVVATWEYPPEISSVELRLLPQESRIGATFRHISHVVDSYWIQFGPGAFGIFWDLAFMRLATYLARGPEGSKFDLSVWAASIEGYKFMLMSSQAWCAANIAAGADPAVAQRAADRTMTAYHRDPMGIE
jgi:uncharacterized protein YndB with AHSA1/START domain